MILWLLIEHKNDLKSFNALYSIKDKVRILTTSKIYEEIKDIHDQIYFHTPGKTPLEQILKHNVVDDIFIIRGNFDIAYYDSDGTQKRFSKKPELAKQFYEQMKIYLQRYDFGGMHLQNTHSKKSYPACENQLPLQNIFIKRQELEKIWHWKDIFLNANLNIAFMELIDRFLEAKKTPVHIYEYGCHNLPQISYKPIELQEIARLKNIDVVYDLPIINAKERIISSSTFTDLFV